jgi:hypothetical protein
LLIAVVALLLLGGGVMAAKVLFSQPSTGTAGNAGQVDFRGPQGPQGPPGSDGNVGGSGSPGTAGSRGSAGATGAQGISGVASCPNGICVSLQAATPGVPEAGNINISGALIANSLQGDGTNLTNVNAALLGGNASSYFTNASNLASGTLADTRLTANVTLQGNAFNGSSQLVQTTVGGALPVISGANLTSLNGSNISSGTVADARLSTNVTLQGNAFNGSSQLVQTTAGGVLPVLSGVNLTNVNAALLGGNASSYFTNASNLASGTLADARLSANVTLQGNSFNGISQLVQTTVGGALPTLSGINLTSLNGSNVASGTVADARLSANVALLNGSGPQTFIGNDKFTGTLLQQNAADSTTAFQIQNAAGSSNLFVADTTNTRIGIGITNPSFTLDVNGNLRLGSTSGSVQPVLARGSGGGLSVDTTGGTVSSGNTLLNVNNNGTQLVTVLGTGATTFKNSSNSTTAFQVQNAAGTAVLNVDTTNQRVGIGTASPQGKLHVSGGSVLLDNAWSLSQFKADGVTQVVVAQVLNTDHLRLGSNAIDTTTGGGSPTLYVTSNNGNVGIGTATFGTNNRLIVNPYSTVDNLATAQINANAATNKGLVIQGFASQTADLQEWQNSAGKALVVVENLGDLTIRPNTGGASPVDTALFVEPRLTTTVGLTVQGLASQTGNLLQLRNSSGTVLSKFDASGNLTVPSVTLSTSTAKPTCDSTKRGTFWFTQNGAGVKDAVEVCAKDAGDAYAWRTIY